MPLGCPAVHTSSVAGRTAAPGHTGQRRTGLSRKHPRLRSARMAATVHGRPPSAAPAQLSSLVLAGPSNPWVTRQASAAANVAAVAAAAATAANAVAASAEMIVAAAAAAAAAAVR